jgi:CRISPR/Cas system-associated exonuclease Cas4 (RecB family)
MKTANYKLADLRKEPHFSYSALNCFLNICQLQYYFRYIEKLQSEQVSVALPFGSAFHSALSEQAQAAKQGKLLTAQELTDAFATYFKAALASNEKVIFKKDETADDLILLAGRMLDSVTLEWCDYWNIEAVALPFRIDFPDSELPLIGELDMVISQNTPFDAQETNYCIVDFKTAARMWPDGKADRDLQATVFTYAFEKLYGQKADFRFDIITKTKNLAVKRFHTRRSEDNFARLERIVSEVNKAVKAGVFLPNETSFACASCPYASSCASWHCNKPINKTRKEAAA